ncbi:MAG: PASTA domain-containing protein, partial [Longimicrobiales bacterium]
RTAAPVPAAVRARAGGSGVVQLAAVARPAVRRAVAGDAAPRVVPDVSGMSMRDGVRRLHEAGFRLHVEGHGRVLRTIPAPGTAMRAASVIRVIGGGDGV